MSPDEIEWEKHFRELLGQGLDDAVAAATADIKTYGKTMNNPMPKPLKTI